MTYQNKNTLWFFVKSMTIMAIILWPFFSIGKVLLSGRFVNPWTSYIVDTIFAPAAWIFNVLCASMDYCVIREYPGIAVMLPLYILSVILYGYSISLIWRWVSVPNINSHYRRQYKEFDEHDGIY